MPDRDDGGEIMERQEAEIEWILTGPITGAREGDGIRVRDAEGRECLLTIDADGNLLFDGRYVDVGDDLPEFWAIMEEIAATGASAPDPDRDEEDTNYAHLDVRVSVKWKLIRFGRKVESFIPKRIWRRSSNAKTIFGRLIIFRHQRSARFGHEWLSYEGTRYINVWWGSPTHHRWWARSVYLYITK
jgi:hypothetical protein